MGNKSSDPFWNLSATRILTWGTNTVRQFEPIYHTLSNVLYVIQKLSGEQEEIDALMGMKTTSKWLYESYCSIVNMGENVLPSVLATVIASLQLFNDPNISATTSINTLDMTSYRTKPKILFIQNKIMNQEYVSGLNSLLFMAWFSETINSLPKEGEHTLVYLIDECSSLKMKKSILPLASSNLRKHNSYGIYGYQSFAQVEQMLGREGATTLKQNTGTIFYLPNQDLHTAQDISRQLGKYTYQDENGTFREPELLTSDQVSYLEKGIGGILFSGNQRGILLKNTLPFYKIKKYLKWSKESIEPLEKLKTEIIPVLPIQEIIQNKTNNEEE
jgi:type IV secretory pathway TraG/TraD family ATPase VirD4